MLFLNSAQAFESVCAEASQDCKTSCPLKPVMVKSSETWSIYCSYSSEEQKYHNYSNYLEALWTSFLWRGNLTKTTKFFHQMFCSIE